MLTSVGCCAKLLGFLHCLKRLFGGRCTLNVMVDGHPVFFFLRLSARPFLLARDDMRANCLLVGGFSCVDNTCLLYTAHVS